MDASTTRRVPTLRWGAILAGAVVAVAIGWMGELLGGLLALIEPGESSAWGWIGGFISLAALALGGFVGALLAARAAGATSRTEALFHGLVVWGLLGTVSAMLFAVLGGNVALVAGETAGAVRLALGFGSMSLLIALGASALGALAGASAAPLQTRRARSARVAPRAETPSRDVTDYATRGPEDRGPTPPSIH